jgi:YkoY family integral membrane protein
MFGQTFEFHDIAVVALLVVLEGVLSIDNALVLGLLARPLPRKLQRRALTYGLIGAFAFRLLAVATAAYLLRWRFVKLLGGGYLVYIAIRHLIVSSRHEPERTPRPHRFWGTVLVIELTDIAFAIDSILAAIALVGSAPAGTPPGAWHPKLWVVIAGGMIGVILMRFAATIFIKLLEKFPRFEMAAYLLVLVIGLKLLADWAVNTPEHPHRLNFHSYENIEFWAFWIAMLASFLVGFLPKKGKPQMNTDEHR